MLKSPSASDTQSHELLRRKDVVFRGHPRAKRYLAKVDSEGNIVLTVPKRGTQRDALAFANEHVGWLREEQAKARNASQAKLGLRVGDSIWLRGERVTLWLEKDLGRPVLCFGEHRVYIADEGMDLRLSLERYFRELAKTELPALVFSAAERYGLTVKRVLVRDQKTRWGSCSTSGTISLNWRLLLASEETRDYVIAHELMHMKRFDHSPQFWALVEEVCPDYREHEKWLRMHQSELSW